MPVSKEKVRKIIKKVRKILTWTVGIFVFLCVGLYFVLRSPACQTWICQRLAAYMSDELKTTIRIGGVDIQFFTSVVLEDIYVEDQHGDTLLDAPSLVVDISQFDYSTQYMNVKAVTLTDANIKVKKYPNEKGLNFRFFVQYFKSADTTPKVDSTPWRVDLGKIKLENCRFAYIDTRFNDADRGMDYENIQVRDIFATLEEIEQVDDSTSLYLSELKAKERSGFTVDHMESRMMIADTFIKFNELKIQTPGSDVKGFLGFHYHTWDDVEDDFVHRVTMIGHFSESIVEMGDIAYFSPVMLGIQKKVMLTGDLNGTVDKLKTRNVDLRFGERSRVAGNFSFDGLPDIDNTDMNLQFRETTTNYNDLKGIPVAPFDDTSYLYVQPRIEMLGDMYFTGRVEGFVSDFVAHGKLRTAQGDLVLHNLVMQKDSTIDDYAWNGILTAENFNIGPFLGVDDMGHISGTANMVGIGTDVPTMVASMNANFSSLEYHNYAYSNITVTEGSLAKQVFDGKITVNDPNVHLVYDGYVDFVNSKDPKMNFTANIDSAQVSKLGFADTSWHLVVNHANMKFNMHGSNIDNLDGFMRFSDLSFTKNDKPYYLDGLGLTSSRDAAGRHMLFDSDFLIANLDGQFELMKLPDAVTDVMSAYLPAYFPPRQLSAKQKKENVAQQFSWSANFGRNTDAIAAFIPGLYIAPRSMCSGSFDQTARNFTLFVRSDSLKAGAYTIKQINYVKANGVNGKASLDLSIERAQVSDSTGFDNIAISATAANNILDSKLSWRNTSDKENSGLLRVKTEFESEKSLQMNIEEGAFVYNDTTWRVDPTNSVRRDSSVLVFNNLIFRSGKQYIGVNGRISENPTDHLDVHLDGFNLSSLNYLTEPSGVNVSGYITGTAVLSDLYNAPTFTGDATIDELYMNKERLGDGSISATWFAKDQGVYISDSLWRTLDQSTGKPIPNLVVTGFYYPKKPENNLALEAHLYQMQLSILQPVLSDFCSVMNGKIDGQVNIGGEFSRPLLEGYAELNIRKVKVDYLGIELTQWKTPQRVEIHDNAFTFNDFKIQDNGGDTAVINGNLFHDNFKRFQFDMYFEFDHFQVLNTTESMNEDYFGRVWASGYMDIFGYTDKTIWMNISAKTEGVIRNGNFISSDFNIPMSTTSEAGTGEFIEFKSDSAVVKPKKPVFNDNGIDLNLNLSVTDESALVHVIFDETVGDELSARGNSDNINIHILPNGDFGMYGDYRVKRGNYLFTLKNIIYTPFDLVDGGIISWNGDPTDAQIDADAIYVANTSVEPFFPYDTTTAEYQQNYEVDVIMHLDGKLMNPALSFDIELPTADPDIQETVKSYTQSELEMNRQVLSLMVLNSFMTPSEFREGTEPGSEGRAAGTTLLSNFVSGTLNNWLSQISENANLKFKYRPNEDMSLQELKLALGTQLMNNRLTFDVAGSVTNASQTQAQNGYNIWGDVNVEYKVTEDGKVRLRAFNRGAESNQLENEGTQYTQGAGIFYREDFETFGELFHRWRTNITAPNPNRKPRPGAPQQIPKDTIKLAPPDTINPSR